jgi:hypothetical protein
MKHATPTAPTTSQNKAQIGKNPTVPTGQYAIHPPVSSIGIHIRANKTTGKPNNALTLSSNSTTIFTMSLVPFRPSATMPATIDVQNRPTTEKAIPSTPREGTVRRMGIVPVRKASQPTELMKDTLAQAPQGRFKSLRTEVRRCEFITVVRSSQRFF